MKIPVMKKITVVISATHLISGCSMFIKGSNA